MKFLFLYLNNSQTPLMIAWPSDKAPLPDVILNNLNQVMVFDDMYKVNEFIFENISYNDRFRMHAPGDIIPEKLYC